MSFVRLIENAFKWLLPNPFTIAVLLTVLTFFLAGLLTNSSQTGIDRFWELAGFWEQGFWNSSLLVFAVQMMLMLVLGHALALTQPVDRLINYTTQFCTTTAKAAALVTLLTVLVALFNWGLGLVFGAILARKVGEFSKRNQLGLNYPLIGAAGYSGLMVWHGGISGSAPIKAAESGHVKSLMEATSIKSELLPDSISFSSTVFGSMNLTATALVVLILPLFMYFLGKKMSRSDEQLRTNLHKADLANNNEKHLLKGLENLDHWRWFSLLIGCFILVYLIHSANSNYYQQGLGFITPNFINLLLLGLCLLFHQSIASFLNAIDQAIGGASGILIQFPLYFGIMGLMNHSGLVQYFSDFFVTVSTSTSFPVYTFFSAGFVNIFVPSGGGQWGVQGPIILQAATELGVPLPKAIMALAYGDQLTNMLQPFWALPLLGITGLRATAILPYSFALMLVGMIIYISVLLIF
jgi:short-chain fatty acids transporter